jgi:hypothetical protein
LNVIFNGTDFSCGLIEEFGVTLDRFDSEPQFELRVSTQNGRSIAMLRNGDHAWLTYLRFQGDSGVVTRGDQGTGGSCTYRLANGEVNEIPLSWCVDLEQCYRTIAYFFVNDGARYDFVDWQEA